LENKELVSQLIAALEERGAPDAIAITDLMRVEQKPHRRPPDRAYRSTRSSGAEVRAYILLYWA
jgi:hypothetical protein